MGGMMRAAMMRAAMRAEAHGELRPQPNRAAPAGAAHQTPT